MNNVKLVGTGSYVPDNVVTNHQLSQWVDTSDQWIYSRTGIKERRISNGITASEMGSKASIKALNQAAIDPTEIDLIIVATMTADKYLPSVACEIQRDIKAEKAVCFDLNAACSGFLYAYNVAVQFIKTGTYKKALIVGTEVLSKLVDWEDRGTCVLFGDGAGAAIISQSEEEGFIQMKMGSDGRMSKALLCDSRPLNNPFIKEKDDLNLDYIKMDGQDIFKFVCSTIPNNILDLFEETEHTLNDVSHFILHQANKRIIQAVAKRLGADINKFFTNLDQYGNTSAASIPIALDEINRQNKLKKGDLVVLSGFGGGLTWGSALLKI
ncbi:3-oxoacyl-[acyl-carrier-protein] synthase III [Natranaerovirga hydrolytica]|uniref:Beta-ketoacyl-[acyl-carrier-protein] synthase III n=1 Tax=Natranaerovirga hydrolytica TaxID=680378 RepID=A0A4R1M4K2_9FIRM|nr:beta-ketoacyl-ACP synthase III [Natranaerovirga hydrolytica]TCK86745.1 3-oxoacyl-[acyl-carrier-protein] synthase III [Natranaerovirga hydrolytica]